MSSKFIPLDRGALDTLIFQAQLDFHFFVIVEGKKPHCLLVFKYVRFIWHSLNKVILLYTK